MAAITYSYREDNFFTFPNRFFVHSDEGMRRPAISERSLRNPESSHESFMDSICQLKRSKVRESDAIIQCDQTSLSNVLLTIFWPMRISITVRQSDK